MANTKAAKKAYRSSLRKRAYNLASKTKVKTALKSFRSALASDSKEFQMSLSAAYSALDKAAKTNFIPKRRADRKKSRLAQMAAKAGLNA